MEAEPASGQSVQRYYDPMIPRFLSVDPVTAYDNGDMRFFNRYSYAFHNPYRFSDPDGRCPDKNPCHQATPFSFWRNTMPGRVVAGTLGNFAALFDKNHINPFSGNQATAPELFDAKVSAVAAVASAFEGVAAGVSGSLSEALAARDALSESLAPLKGKAPATVTGGYNVRTGEVAARACGGGNCAENECCQGARWQ